MDDFDIVEMYWDRNEDAIYHTDKKYNRYCSGIAYNILFNAEDTKECVNDTWLKAWETIPPQRPENLAAYLGKITRNLALSKYHKNAALKRNAKYDTCIEELEEILRSSETVEDLILSGEKGRQAD